MSNARILVVDDDQVIQQLLKVNLELEGYTVEVASDGEEALVLFDRFRPDLVLLDIMMPKLDGWEVARRLAGTTGG
ncbi:MAG TPA: response regulator, partial [Actinomycetota bacterium]|nr:response regulator [Actinomycetota bacterium]